jgi:hypothetical protein
LIDFVYARDSANKNTNIASYSIQENSVSITYTGAADLEREGFTIGFGQNVFATKGTYSSSGNVNDGIHVTWQAPPLLSTVEGFNPRYTVYRRAVGDTWQSVTTVNAPVYIDTSTDLRGNAIEYVIGISNGSGNPTQPQLSKRFIDFCNTLRDDRDRPNMLGFMLGMVRMHSVSRGELPDVNAQFGEQVTWRSSGINNPNLSHYNAWGIEGYTIYVMNRNIDNNWHEIFDTTEITNHIYQDKILTPHNTPSVNNNVGVSRNLLFVLRDYKHFFKVRSYVMFNDVKIYSPDPVWTYQYDFGRNQADHIAASVRMQNEYVMWGARQVTANEFIAICTLFMARGIQRVNGNSWNTAFTGFPYFDRTANASPGLGGSGNIHAGSNFGVTEWTFTFNNYKDDIQARCGQWLTFISINGRTRARTSASNQFPQRYREYDGNAWLDITGPWDTPNLYTGRIKVGTGSDNNANNLHWGSGQIRIIYPSGTSEQNHSFRGQDTPLQYSGQGSERYHAWR